MTLLKNIGRASFSGILVIFLFSCASVKVSKDLVDYVNQDIMNISQLEILALKHYTGVTGTNFTSDERVHSTLKSDVLPLYRRFHVLLKNISPENKDLKIVHMIYVKGSEEILNGFNSKMIALERKDEGLLRLANQQIDHGGKEVAKWRVAMAQLVTKSKSVRMKP